MNANQPYYERRARPSVQSTTLDIYEFVIDDTVSRVKGEFVQEGVDECVNAMCIENGAENR